MRRLARRPVTGIFACLIITAACATPKSRSMGFKQLPQPGDSPSFDRENVIPELNGRIADFFMRHIVVPRKN